MTFQEALEQRKSIRKYIARPVEEEKVREMIEAAMLAPSWKNSQTTHYYVAMGEMLQKVRDALPAFNQRNTENAPVLIVSTFVTCVSGYDVKAGEPSNELGNGWGAYDCGLHDMALLLKASELGLSTLVMGIRDAEKLREVLSVPAYEQIVSVIAVGYAAVDPERPARKELTEIAKFFH